ncbi:beta-lactamase family protein [Paenibacillus melissococcoides]|uniref:Beta-lactamase family protein n=2 Tax=Paenibacillus TaxID=44249 RepID=A0ABM9FYY7_9BACL|nr:beta-lactamase family protein [Paenibacillus melissococcoides]CAH8244464.1 beta-lactamase family protein [Paenibacillus melissococcoides]CAH8708069.1 beta-lactamase family protein [Paenibacillus melissococcoides]CAH8708776.1 beta-lactamase family protein [Paenibacillus melissococcoides]
MIIAGMVLSGLGYDRTTFAAAAKARPSGPADARELERFADAFFEKREPKDAGGAVVVVVKDGRVLLKKGYGYADMERKVPVDPDKTVFRIASVSKVFTAAAVMQLAEQGKIDLHADINRYMGDIRIDNPFKEPVTMHHLLTHTSGFQATLETMDDFPEDLSRTVSIQSYIKERMSPVVRKPGEAYMYDNFAYILQGYIIEQVSGMPFHQYMKEHIFKPLGMASSDFLLTKEVLERLANGYDPSGKPISVYGVTPTEGPDGAMNTTGSDIAQFMIAQLNGGANDHGRILRPETVEAMQLYREPIHPAFPDATYGFENVLDPAATNGQHVISKGGDLLGFASCMWLLPDQKTGIFISANAEGMLRSDWYAAFMNQYYPKKEQVRTFLRTPMDQLRRLEGVYLDLRLKIMQTTVTATGDGELLVEDVLGRHTAKQIDTLLFEDKAGKLLAFKENADHTVDYLKYRNPVSYAQKITQQAFRDVAEDSPYASHIHYLRAIDRAAGFKDGTFRPGKPVTRAELIALMTRTLGYPLSEQLPAYADAANHWARAEIQTALELGLAEGVSEDRFGPEETLSRQEAAEMIVRGMAPILENARPDLSGVKLAGGTDDTYADSVKTMAALELYGPEVKLLADGAVDFGSRQEMTRQEAALVMSKLMDLMLKAM